LEKRLTPVNDQNESVRELIRREQDRLQLRSMLLDGAASASGAPVSGVYFDALRARINREK